MNILSDRLNDVRLYLTRKRLTPHRIRVDRLRRLSLESLEGRELLTTITVTTVADTVGGAAVSLRDAIMAADSDTAVGSASAGQAAPVIDQIDFDIPGISAGQDAVIHLTSALPAITEAVEIDGFTQPGASSSVGNFVVPVELDGSGAGTGANGLTLLNQEGSAIRGLDIVKFSSNGVFIQGGGQNIIDQDEIGTDTLTESALPNGRDGVFIAADSTGNRIGAEVLGSTTEDIGDVISGNVGNGIEVDGNQNIIERNDIGTNDAATVALGNGANGILINGQSNTLYGDVELNERQVISGNKGDGIRITGDDNTVQNGFVGVGVSGDSAIPNGGNGLTLTAGANNNVIGALAGGLGNDFSGNVGSGVEVDGTNNTIEGNLIGTNSTGEAAVANGAYGVALVGSENNVIGTYSSQGNEQVISGNTLDGVLVSGNQDTVRANFIGLDPTGQVAVANHGNGVTIAAGASGNVIGSIAERQGNDISGNLGNGVSVAGNGTFVEGNFIGTNGTGTAAVGNGQDGVYITGNLTRVFGTFAPGGISVISGNLGDGIRDAGGTGNVFTASLIGLNIAGTAAIPNDGNGITMLAAATDDTVGAIGANLPAFVSGNLGDGVEVDGNNDFVLNNFIGTNQLGTAAVPNGGDGVLLKGSNGGVIGSRGINKQVIAGNTGDGIRVAGNSNILQGNDIGVGVDEKTSIPNGGQGLDLAGGILSSISNNAGINGLAARTSTYQVFVNEVYLMLLDRPADLGGLNQYTALLMKGGSRVKVVQLLEDSNEYLDLVVQHAYEHYLGRSADAATVKEYAARLAKGGTEAALDAALLGTTEFLQAKGMGTNAGFSEALYGAVLDRAPSATEQAALTAKLSKGTSRTAVATALLSGPEAETIEVDGLFEQALDREPTASELSLYVGQLARKKTVASILAQLIGSDEFLFDL